MTPRAAEPVPRYRNGARTRVAGQGGRHGRASQRGRAVPQRRQLLWRLRGDHQHFSHSLHPSSDVQLQIAQPLHRDLFLHGLPRFLHPGRLHLPVRHAAGEHPQAETRRRRSPAVPPTRPERPQNPQDLQLRHHRGVLPRDPPRLHFVPRLSVHGDRIVLRTALPHGNAARIRVLRGIPPCPAWTATSARAPPGT
jgi:hypothetical protein